MRLAAHVSVIAAIFLGVKAAVLAIVVQAVLRVAGRALKGPFQRWLAAAVVPLRCSCSMRPFPLVVGVAALLGIVVTRIRPDWLKLHAAPQPGGAVPCEPSPAGTAGTILGWGVVWWAPMLAILLTLGQHHVLWDVGLFFSKLAVVTFGGAYAVLAYMGQQAVDTMGWLSAKEMADGLGSRRPRRAR